ncbi:MAG: ABC transporter ATP-binding protein [Lachnospiraceae bacterium]|nr:ABC transporter ATP-binding protein [Lachnospiraceae bacterium]
MLKLSWKLSRPVMIISALSIPLTAATAPIAAILPSAIVEYVSNGYSSNDLLIMIVGFSLVLFAISTTIRLIDSNIFRHSLGNRVKLEQMLTVKLMNCDYYKHEDPDFDMKFKKAIAVTNNNTSIGESLFIHLPQVISNVIGLITYSVLIWTLSPVIVIILFVCTIILYFSGKMNADWTQANKANWQDKDRRINYLFSQAGDLKAAKDMRLYGISGWFADMYKKLLGERIEWGIRREKRIFAADFVTSALTLIRDAFAYGILVYSIACGELSASQFVFYFALIGQYSSYLFGIINTYNTLYKNSLNISDFREILDDKDIMNHGEGIPFPKGAPEIRFENVSFRYPKADANTINNLSFTIQAGEKIAIVGLNGAGKTTLIKLLCGFYVPTEGRILINGHELIEYNLEEYHEHIAAVFQKIELLPLSIEDNIVFNKDNFDDKKLAKVLELSGLNNKIKALPQGVKSKFDRTLYEDAVDFSGGEIQKLALARALYKEGSIIILDEPTSALDPIAENEIYQKYNDLTKNATSIFISHRLASTRFCDRILFLEHGDIAERGSHDELMKLGGKYAELFEIQSHYYKKEA